MLLEESRKTRPEIAEKASFIRSVAAETISSEVFREYTEKKGSIEDDNRLQVQESRTPRGNPHCNNRYEPATEMETLLMKRSSVNRATLGTVRGKGAENDEQIINVNNRSLKEGAPLESFNCRSNGLQHVTTADKLVGHLQHQEFGRESGFKKQQQQQLISTTSLPEWTDEQLDELFKASCEDDDTFLL